MSLIGVLLRCSSTGTDPWGHSLKLLMAAVVAGGGVVMGLMAFMQNKVPFAT